MLRYQDLLLHLVRYKRRCGPKAALRVHTGGIDCTWKKIKDKIPPSIQTRKKGQIRKDLMANVDCVLRATAKQLRKQMNMWG